MDTTPIRLPLFTFDENGGQSDEDDLKIHFVVTYMAEDSSRKGEDGQVSKGSDLGDVPSRAE